MRLSVAQGERVAGTGQQAGTELLRTAGLQHIEVHIMVEETGLWQVAEGQRAQVRLEALTDQRLTGTVSHISYQATAYDQLGGRVFAVHIDLDLRAMSFRPKIKSNVSYKNCTRS